MFTCIRVGPFQTLESMLKDCPQRDLLEVNGGGAVNGTWEAWT